MTGRRPFKELTKKFSAERKARVEARVTELKQEMMLSELRQARAHTQQKLARALKVNQPAVAKLEKRADMYVSNLRHYIEALGGSLEITARFPNTEVRIKNFTTIGSGASIEARTKAPSYSSGDRSLGGRARSQASKQPQASKQR
jgi:transcriptional regulator with XRE-family HTH domain